MFSIEKNIRKINKIEQYKMPEYVQFHSRSAIDKSKRFPYPDAMRRLSNFSNHNVEYKGILYETVEHAFQAQKYDYTKKQLLMPVDVAPIKEFFHNGEIQTPQMAKTQGGKSAMKSRGVELDIDAWNQVKDTIMRDLIASKIERHDDIRQILLVAKDRNYLFLHFARNDFEWGGQLSPNKKDIIGENKLGNIYNDWIHSIQ